MAERVPLRAMQLAPAQMQGGASHCRGAQTPCKQPRANTACTHTSREASRVIVTYGKHALASAPVANAYDNRCAYHSQTNLAV